MQCCTDLCTKCLRYHLSSWTDKTTTSPLPHAPPAPINQQPFLLVTLDTFNTSFVCAGRFIRFLPEFAGLNHSPGGIENDTNKTVFLTRRLLSRYNCDRVKTALIGARSDRQ